MFPLTLALIGTQEMIIIGLIIVLFFGAAKIPELARSLGRAKGEFEKGAREGRDAAAKEAAPMEDTEKERVLKAAQELGIKTEGRSVADIKADVRAKLS